MKEEEMSVDENSLRPITCELNHLSMPDGSAMLMQGRTSVVAGVYGPIEGRLHKMLYDKAFIEVSYSPISGPGSVDDRLMEQYIKDTCESAIITTLHPSTAISITVQEIEDSGGLLACAMNAACLALINAGLSMKFTVGAVACMIDKKTNEIILDPCTTQLKTAKAHFTFAFDGIKRDMICCYTEGRFSQEQYETALDKSRQASQSIFKFYRDIVHKYAHLI